MDKITHEMRMMQWTSIIRECRSSGMTVKAWCLENNVNAKRFYYWQRRIRKDAFDSLKKLNHKTSQTLCSFWSLLILQGKHLLLLQT